MTTHLVTFSDESMSRSRELCHRSAIVKGGIGTNHCHVCTPYNVRELQDSYPSLFVQGKGFGYWSWKPYLINQLTEVGGFVRNVREGDVVVYADSGIEFIAPVSHIISRMDQDIFLFGNNWEHAHWCKSDVVAAVWPTTDREFWKGDPMGWSRFGKQVQASVIFFRVSDYTRRFVQEWLAWCLTKVPADSQVGLSCGHWWKGDVWSRCPKCGDVAVENRSEYLIDDSPSRNRNHPEFQEHRHDQAILTTMAYREGIKLHYWPAMYNDGAFTYEKLPCYAEDDYPILFHHHRRRNHEWA